MTKLATRSRSQMSVLLKIVTRNKNLLTGLLILLPFVLIGFLSDFIVPYNSARIGSFPVDLQPSVQHLFGTDTLGRDISHQIVQGIRNSLIIGLTAGTIGTIIGTVIGLIAGYKGEIVDSLCLTITDTFLVIPTWPLLVLLSTYVRELSITLMAMIISAFIWSWPTRTLRAQVKSLMEREFVNISKLSDLSDVEIAFTEIMPNMLPYIGVIFSNAVSGAMISEVGLEMIGLGPRNTATLGLLLYYAIFYGALSRGAYMWAFVPAICLVLVFISLQMINVGLDEIYNPRLRR